jgi:hypothetical protein
LVLKQDLGKTGFETVFSLKYKEAVPKLKFWNSFNCSKYQNLEKFQKRKNFC